MSNMTSACLFFNNINIFHHDNSGGQGLISGVTEACTCISKYHIQSNIYLYTVQIYWLKQARSQGGETDVARPESKREIKKKNQENVKR